MTKSSIDHKIRKECNDLVYWEVDDRYQCMELLENMRSTSASALPLLARVVDHALRGDLQ